MAPAVPSVMNGSLVRDRMTAPVVTERPDTSVTALSAVLKLRGISAVPVVEGGELVGIVSTTDILRAPRIARVRDVMTAPVVTVSVDDALDAAAERLADKSVHRVVALEGHRVAGILSARDVLTELKQRKVMSPIGDVMSAPVQSIEIGAGVDEAIRLLSSSNVHGIVVVDGATPVGVFTHAEALAVRRLSAPLNVGPVEDWMSYETVCLDVSTPVYRAAAYAVSMNIRRLLIVEHRRLVGVVSCLDLVRILARRDDPSLPLRRCESTS
jgi:CBS domain-containing protein